MSAFSALVSLGVCIIFPFFGLFVGFSATQMFLDKKPEPSRQVPGFAGLLTAGSGIGFLSGLVGAGGGFISVPFMTWCNVAIHNAVATSAALGFPIALFNALGYVYSGWGTEGLPTASLGYVWVPAWLAMTSCSMLTAPWGARSAQKLPVQKLFMVQQLHLPLKHISPKTVKN